MGRLRGLVMAAGIAGVLAACRALIGLDDVTLGNPASGADDANADALGVGPGDGATTPQRRLGQVCSRDGFCWVNPLPQGNVARAVWGASENDVWAAADYGTILHFDGQLWSGLTRDARDRFAAIASDGKGKIWIGGSRNGKPLLLAGTNAPFDGDFQEIAVDDGPDAGSASSVLSLWFDGDSTLYAGRDDGAVLKLDGTAPAIKATTASKAITSLWGEKGNDLWAVGSGNTVLRYHYADDTWRTVSVAGGVDWASVVGANNIVYLVGAGKIVEITGSGPAPASFAGPPPPPPDLALRGVTIAGDGTPIAVGTESKGSCVYERDPTTQKWTRSYGVSLGLDVGDGLVGVASAGKEVWSVGVGGAMARRVATKWTPAFERNKVDPTQPDEAVHAILPASDTEVWVVGDKTLSRFGRAKPSQVAAPGPFSSAALIGEAIWATTPDGVKQQLPDGGWSLFSGVSVSSPVLVAGRSALDAFVVGSFSVDDGTGTGGTIPVIGGSRLTDAGWSSAISLGDPTAYVARGIWAGDDGNYYVAYSSCASSPCGPRSLALEAVGSDDKSVGRVDSLSDRDGGPAVTGDLIAVWGMNGEQYYGGVFDANAKVDAGNLVVRNATSASRFLLPRGPVDGGTPIVSVLHGVAGDLWAAGDVATVWHRNGATWDTLASGYADSRVVALFVRAPGDVWIAANTGAILHRVP